MHVKLYVVLTVYIFWSLINIAMNLYTLVTKTLFLFQWGMIGRLANRLNLRPATNLLVGWHSFNMFAWAVFLFPANQEMKLSFDSNKKFISVFAWPSLCQSMSLYVTFSLK